MAMLGFSLQQRSNLDVKSTFLRLDTAGPNVTFSRTKHWLAILTLTCATVSVHGPFPAEKNSIVCYSAVLVTLPSKENFPLVSSV